MLITHMTYSPWQTFLLEFLAFHLFLSNIFIDISRHLAELIRLLVSLLSMAGFLHALVRGAGSMDRGVLSSCSRRRKSGISGPVWAGRVPEGARVQSNRVGCLILHRRLLFTHPSSDPSLNFIQITSLAFSPGSSSFLAPSRPWPVPLPVDKEPPF